MAKRQTQCPFLKVSQIRQTGQKGLGKGLVQEKEAGKLNISTESISVGFAGADALNSVAYEHYDLLALLKSIRSVNVDGPEALLKCDSLVPSLLTLIHTVNIFRNECKTDLLLILVSLKTKCNKCFILLQFVAEENEAGIQNAASSVTFHLLHLQCEIRWGHMGHGIGYFCSVLHKPQSKVYHSC